MVIAQNKKIGGKGKKNPWNTNTWRTILRFMERMQHTWLGGICFPLKRSNRTVP